MPAFLERSAIARAATGGDEEWQRALSERIRGMERNGALNEADRKGHRAGRRYDLAEACIILALSELMSLGVVSDNLKATAGWLRLPVTRDHRTAGGSLYGFNPAFEGAKPDPDGPVFPWRARERWVLRYRRTLSPGIPGLVDTDVHFVSEAEALSEDRTERALSDTIIYVTDLWRPMMEAFGVEGAA